MNESVRPGRIYEASQVVPLPREQVFAFFTDPSNLEAITPPWLRFRIVHRSTPEVGKGSEFTYRLRIRGLPCTWKSRIEEWQPNDLFVDVQISGPYAEWHHTHAFEDHAEGTLIRDRVRYRLPFGRLGSLIAGRYVERDVREIFDYRAARTAELLRSAS